MSLTGDVLDLGKTGKTTPVYTSPQNVDPQQSRRFGTTGLVTIKENTPRSMIERERNQLLPDLLKEKLAV